MFVDRVSREVVNHKVEESAQNMALGDPGIAISHTVLKMIHCSRGKNHKLMLL